MKEDYLNDPKYREMQLILEEEEMKQNSHNIIPRVKNSDMKLFVHNHKVYYEKDGVEGLIRYGAVALRRSLTSKRSNFYYKFDKYYKHIDEFTSTITYDVIETGEVVPNKHLYNLPNEEEDVSHNKSLYKLELIDVELDKLESWYDRELFKLYYSGETLDSLAAKTGISRNSIFTTIDKVRTILKKELNEDV